MLIKRTEGGYYGHVYQYVGAIYTAVLIIGSSGVLIMFRFFALLLVALVLAACAGEPKIQTGPDAEMKDGLSRVVGTTADDVFVAMDVDVSEYKSFYLSPLDTSNTQVDYEPSRHSTNPWGDWKMTDKDRQMLAGYYEKAMTAALQKAGFQLAQKQGAGVVVINASLLEIAPLAPKDDFKSRDPAVDYYSEGAGDLTIQIQLRDGASGRLLAHIEDERAAGTRWEKNTWLNNQFEIRQVFNRWARQFAQRMRSIQER